MKRLLMIAALFLLAGCAPFESILYTPPQTAESWLTIQPYMKIPAGGSIIILVQPSTSAIVYLLGQITIAAGAYYLSIRKNQRSRLWWGIALLLWGAGALVAGTSYEAFSYYLKCASRPACIWTSWYEIAYLILSVASIDAMLAAAAYSGAAGKWWKRLLRYAAIHIILYTILVLVGAWVPVKFLISFELLILVSAPAIVIFLVLHGRRYAQYKQPGDLAQLGAWAWLILTIAAYFGYYLSGLTQRLWAQGAWFSENDVLHIGLILWMAYLVFVQARFISDQQGKPISST